jgi:hypothetical protein
MPQPEPEKGAAKSEGKGPDAKADGKAEKPEKAEAKVPVKAGK